MRREGRGSQWKRRVVGGLALGVVGALAGAQLAWADNLVNDVGASGIETIAAGSSTTVQYKVTGPGSDGCDAADGSPLTVTLAVPAAVTASTTTLTFTSCTPSFLSVTFTSGAAGDHLISASLADTHGSYTNHADFTLHVTGAANTPPTVTVDGVAEGASYEFGAVPTATCNVTDAQDGPSNPPVALSAITGPRASDGLGSQTATCSYTDLGGLSATASATYSIVDTTPPLVIPPADVIAEATGPSGATVDYPPTTAADAVDGSLPAPCAPASGSTFPLGTTPVTCSATDVAGNTGSASFTVTVHDTIAPTLDLPANTVVPAVDSTGAPFSYSATADDAVSGVVTPTCSQPSGATFPLGTTAIDCTATDDAGNSNTASFTVTVQDGTAPVVTVPADIVTEATSAAGAIVPFGVTAEDNVDGPLTPTCSPSSGATFPLGPTAVGCSATDAVGNTGTNGFSVTVVDTTLPALTVPGDVTAEATSPAGAAVDYDAPTASDAVDPDVDISCSVPSGTTFPLGPTTVTCTATDDAGNATTDSFTVTVVDTTPPTVTPPDDVTAEATSPDGAVVPYGAGSATDIVDGSVDVACIPASGSTFALGTTTVTCSATDAAHNTGTAAFDVTVVDTTPPAVTVPANIVAEATSGAGAVVDFAASAADLVDGAVATDCAPASGSTFPLGTTPVTCSATDAAGNTGGEPFTVTVQDTTEPVVTVPPTVVAEATSASGAPVSYTGVSAYDTVDGDIVPDCSPVSSTTFPLGDTTVTCTATDDAANTGTNTFTVRVVDTTAPALTVPAPISVTATSSAGAVVTYSATALDIVDGPVTPVCSHPSGVTFPLGTTTVTCTATDAAVNVSTKSFLVTVRYGWSGVLQPVNPDGSSVFKLGSTVPVKFRLTGASAGITDAVARLFVSRLADGAPGTEVEAGSTSAASTGNTFRYDPTGDLYIFNLATKGLTAGVYQLRIDLGDGSVNTVQITLRK